VVQGVVGLGLGLVGAPVVALVAPELMPGSLLMVAMLMPVVTLWHEREQIDWYGLQWSLPLRVPGTVVGAWLVATLSDRLIGVVVAVVVLGAVALTVRAVELPFHRGSLAVAGFVSGVSGTATSIGGPPIALLYQHRPATLVRPTMAVYFLVGAALSLVALGVTGELTGDEVGMAAVMLPALVVGGLVARPVRRRIGGSGFRAGVLAVCALSSLVLLLRSVAG
jgi:uncharacterized membrane protein YfcA